MFGFEMEIAKRESITPLFSYQYKVVPVSDQAKLYFSLYNKKSGPMELDIKVLIKNNLDVDKFPFIGQLTFFYDDPKETEASRIEMTREHAKFNMTESWVPGITHRNSGKKTYAAPLIEGEDYRIEVSEKIIREQPEIHTWDDIKAL